MLPKLAVYGCSLNQLYTYRVGHKMRPTHICLYFFTPRGKSGGGLRLGKLPKILGFPFNISATAAASDFKFGAQLGFANAHHKITWGRKGGLLPGLGELSKTWGYPSIFTQWLKLATSNLVYSLGLPSSIIKSPPEEKWVWPWARGAPQILGFPFNKLPQESHKLR